jgi:hypothetical protein
MLTLISSRYSTRAIHAGLKARNYSHFACALGLDRPSLERLQVASLSNAVACELTRDHARRCEWKVPHDTETPRYRRNALLVTESSRQQGYRVPSITGSFIHFSSAPTDNLIMKQNFSAIKTLDVNPSTQMTT